MSNWPLGAAAAGDLLEGGVLFKAPPPKRACLVCEQEAWGSPVCDTCHTDLSHLAQRRAYHTHETYDEAYKELIRRLRGQLL